MDLDGFELDELDLGKTSSALDAPGAVEYLNEQWYSVTSRKGRSMDLVGDYAGSELFLIDGNSLIQEVLDDDLLALGRNDVSFQILHAKHTLEQLLQNFQRRDAVFEIAFWETTRHSVLRPDNRRFQHASRVLARAVLFQHLQIARIPIHVFTGTEDPKWHEYRKVKKPMFVMLNDGGSLEGLDTPYTAEIVLMQRFTMFNLLSQGLGLALLHGAVFRDSKIITLIMEQRLDPNADSHLPPEFSETLRTASTTLQTREVSVLGFGGPICLLSDPQIPDGPELSDLDSSLSMLLQSYRTQHSAVLPQTAELLFVFIAHCYLLIELSVEERARPLQAVDAALYDLLRDIFLPRVFSVLYNSHLHCILPDLDGRIFIGLLLCIMRNPDLALDEIIGVDVLTRVEDIWDRHTLPDVDFSALSGHYGIPAVASPASSESSLPEPLGVLPFSNPVFDDVFDPVDVGMEGSDEPDRAPYFGFNERFVDASHWHNHRRAILSKHLGGESAQATDSWQRMKQLRRDQNFKKQLQWQAKTLTGAFGAILEPIVIVREQSPSPMGPPSRAHARKQPKKEHISSADKIRRANMEKKQVDAEKSDRTWWTQELASLEKMPTTQRVARLEALQRNERRARSGGWLAVMFRLYDLNLRFLQWLEDPDADHPVKSASVRDRFTVAVMSKIKSVSDAGGLWPSAVIALKSILTALGFSAYIPSLVDGSPNQTSVDRKLGFAFSRLDDFMRITEHPVSWQLRLFGEHMDRSMDSQSDPRVSFKPDAWQRRVLNCLDANESVLVVAPTSAGKTFISYYAMEKVLRGSDADILVYIAPTKALVTQIAAEVYGRFTKTYGGSARSCWAIHTRDYRINDPTNCQILITVPEILATLLLSPALARAWTPRIKWIILDEIHTIGQQDGGAVWEQIILLAPCPIIGLSATIGQPEKFNTWLESVQHQHGFKHEFIIHPHRYSHLRKFTYITSDQSDPTTFPGLDGYIPGQNIQFLHPVSLLSSGVRVLPTDFSLEARDCFTLYKTLHVMRANLPVDISELKPSRYFQKGQLLRQKDVLSYEARLKEVLLGLMEQSDPQDPSSAIQGIIDRLQPNDIAEADAVPDTSTFLDNLLYLLSDLHSSGDLPALLFQFDRKACEVMAIHLLSSLEASEQKWRETNPQWASTIRKWEHWQSGKKERERQAEKTAKKQKKQGDNDDDNARIEPTSSWEETFDPGDPSPQFSFVGKSAYTKADLEEAIRDMSWVSIPQWALDALRRGIAVHHAGMNKAYRSLVESLYRLGFIRVIICTGTLALGINAPTKTSVFCGDSPFLTALMYRQCAGRAGRRGFDLLGKVVFYGLAMDRIQRLVLSRLPSLGGNFPMTSTMVLRLFNLLEGSGYAPYAESAIRSMLRLPHVSFTSDIGRDQLLHHTRFSIDYLRRSGLLDAQGHPVDLFGVAAHLYYTEPSNLALIALLRHGVIHRICNQRSMIDAEREFMLVMCHLFGRRYLPPVYASASNVKELIRKSPSMVVLPPLPDDARNVLLTHDSEILRVFSGYALTFSSQYADDASEHRLPVSGTTYPRLAAEPQAENIFRSYLQASAVQVTARSPFVANSGHGDKFASVPELTRTARHGLHLNDHAIPSLYHITATLGDPHVPSLLNAYLLDYYIHGQKRALVTANGIREGELWFLLEDFTLCLKAIRSSLEKLLLGVAEEDQSVGETSDPADVEVEPAVVNTEASADKQGKSTVEKKPPVPPPSQEQPILQPATTVANADDPVRPPGVSDADWKVFRVVHRVTVDFEAKFKAMWA